MRLISELEWSEFFESISLVDEVLRSGSTFAQMDFVTRNLYRSGIEELSRGTKLTEVQIARAAVAAASDSTAVTDGQRDPGYYLIAAGRRAFETAIGYRAPLSRLSIRWIKRRGAGTYISAILLFAAIILALPLLALGAEQVQLWKFAWLALLGVIPALDAAVTLVNRAVSSGIGATVLPGLALREGVPPPLRTLIAVPTLLTTPEAIEEELERLEIHHLASPEGELHFALLSDWVDAPTEHTAADAALLRDGHSWNRAAEPKVRACRIRQPLLAPPPSARLERGATTVDWMGT